MSHRPRVPTAVVLFTRDLRIHDNPVLAAACAEAEQVVPLFVLDPAIGHPPFAGPHRASFLAACLADLDGSLRDRGGHLVVRAGDPVEQACRIAGQVDADRVHLARDVSRYASARERRLRAALATQRRELAVHDGVHTIVPPGELTPAGADHFAVFTPYFRRWTGVARRRPAPAPAVISVPALDPGRLPPAGAGVAGTPGGESAGRRRMMRWLTDELPNYQQRQDLLAADGTSRLSPYLHLGCLSELELATRAAGDPRSPRGEAFIRQLAWRDFHHQVLAARPDAAHADYRPRGDTWREDPDELTAWREGLTGYPIVDAGLRQLLAEGWMHNRARLITASFLTKTLYHDWRAGLAARTRPPPRPGRAPALAATRVAMAAARLSRPDRRPRPGTRQVPRRPRPVLSRPTSAPGRLGCSRHSGCDPTRSARRRLLAGGGPSETDAEPPEGRAHEQPELRKR
jgi:deoxyribodipyrimidine photo-lyase